MFLWPSVVFALLVTEQYVRAKGDYSKVMKILAHHLAPLSVRISLVTTLAVLLLSCDRETPDPGTAVIAEATQTAVTDEQPDPQPLPPAESRPPSADAQQPQFSIDDNPYVFDVASHSRQNLLAVLKRANEVATDSSGNLKQLNITVVVHGRRVRWFDKQNYEENKELVDLAAKLDALDVINVKIDQQAMQEFGVQDENVPDFIERVPFAADEITRLQGSGHFTL